MADLLDSGPDESRPHRWERRVPGRRVRRALGIGAVVLVGGALVGHAVRPPPPPRVPADVPVLSVAESQVKLDGRDQAAALSLTVVNSGPSAFLDAVDGLPSQLVFVPPRGGLPVPGGTTTRLPLAWPRVDCTTDDEAFGHELAAATFVFRDPLANGSVVALGTVPGAVAQILRLRAEACAHFVDL